MLHFGVFRFGGADALLCGSPFYTSNSKKDRPTFFSLTTLRKVQAWLLVGRSQAIFRTKDNKIVKKDKLDFFTSTPFLMGVMALIICIDVIINKSFRLKSFYIAVIIATSITGVTGVITLIKI
jgi:hypothetical protein